MSNVPAGSTPSARCVLRVCAMLCASCGELAAAVTGGLCRSMVLCKGCDSGRMSCLLFAQQAQCPAFGELAAMGDWRCQQRSSCSAQVAVWTEGSGICLLWPAHRPSFSVPPGVVPAVYVARDVVPWGGIGFTVPRREYIVCWQWMPRRPRCPHVPYCAEPCEIPKMLRKGSLPPKR